MNKSQLIDAIAHKAGMPKMKASHALNALMQIVEHELVRGGSITLVGFGSFITAARAARVGRNPKTGKEIKIAATVTPKFRPGKALKEAVAKKKIATARKKKRK